MDDEKRTNAGPMVEYRLVDTDQIKCAITKLSDAGSFGGLVPIEDVYTEVERGGISSGLAGKIITRLIGEGAIRKEKWIMMIDPQDIDELYEKWKLKQTSTDGKTTHPRAKYEPKASSNQRAEAIIDDMVLNTGDVSAKLVLRELKARMGL